MEPNLNIYQIAATYSLMALFCGVGAALASTSSFLGYVGFGLIICGVIAFLSAILAYNPFLKNKQAEAKEDFSQQ